MTQKTQPTIICQADWFWFQIHLGGGGGGGGGLSIKIGCIRLMVRKHWWSSTANSSSFRKSFKKDIDLFRFSNRSSIWPRLCTYWCQISETESCCSKLQKKLARSNATPIHPQKNREFSRNFRIGLNQRRSIYYRAIVNKMSLSEHREMSIYGIEVLANYFLSTKIVHFVAKGLGVKQ